MKLPHPVKHSLSVITRYRYKWVMIIAICWTLIDVIGWVHFMQRPYEERSETTFQYLTPGAIILRTIIVLGMSLVMGYLLVFQLRRMFRDRSLMAALSLKTLFLIIASFVMSFLVHITYSLWTLHLSIIQSLIAFNGEAIHRSWIFDRMVNWLVVYLITQLLIEINEKYSPGVFFDILLGKYIRPRVEKRIVMFLDLKDSTPIAEQLGHVQYFRFIRDFIYEASTALLEYNGRIYQYVGDEVVVSWMYNAENAQKCLQAVIAARRSLQKRSEEFRREYGHIPEFRVGIHLGDVTVGEIGAIKRDLAMSGDTMNTTARIRSASAELHHKFIASKDFVVEAGMKDWQVESFGTIELKGKRDSIELFALKI